MHIIVSRDLVRYGRESTPKPHKTDISFEPTIQEKDLDIRFFSNITTSEISIHFAEFEYDRNLPVPDYPLKEHVYKKRSHTIKFIPRDIFNFHTIDLVGSINLPPSVETIENGAFCGSSITSLSAPSVRYVGSGAFCDCVQLRSIDLPEVRSMGREVLFGTNELVSINTPSLTTISEDMLDGAINDSTRLLHLPNLSVLHEVDIKGGLHIRTTRDLRVFENPIDYMHSTEIHYPHTVKSRNGLSVKVCTSTYTPIPHTNKLYPALAKLPYRQWTYALRKYNSDARGKRLITTLMCSFNRLRFVPHEIGLEILSFVPLGCLIRMDNFSRNIGSAMLQSNLISSPLPVKYLSILAASVPGKILLVCRPMNSNVLSDWSSFCDFLRRTEDWYQISRHCSTVAWQILNFTRDMIGACNNGTLESCKIPSTNRCILVCNVSRREDILALIPESEADNFSVLDAWDML